WRRDTRACRCGRSWPIPCLGLANKPPDDYRPLTRVEPDVVRFSMKREVNAKKQVLGFDRRMVRQAEFPKRHLIGTLLGVVRIEIDKGHHTVVARRGQLGERNDIVVPGI